MKRVWDKLIVQDKVRLNLKKKWNCLTCYSPFSQLKPCRERLFGTMDWKRIKSRFVIVVHRTKMKMKEGKLLVNSRCRNFWIIWSEGESVFIHDMNLLEWHKKCLRWEDSGGNTESVLESIKNSCANACGHCTVAHLYLWGQQCSLLKSNKSEIIHGPP